MGKQRKGVIQGKEKEKGMVKGNQKALSLGKNIRYNFDEFYLK